MKKLSIIIVLILLSTFSYSQSIKGFTIGSKVESSSKSILKKTDIKNNKYIETTLGGIPGLLLIKTLNNNTIVEITFMSFQEDNKKISVIDAIKLKRAISKKYSLFFKPFDSSKVRFKDIIIKNGITYNLLITSELSKRNSATIFLSMYSEALFIKRNKEDEDRIIDDF